VVAQVLRLKLAVLGNSFRRTPWQVAGLLFALLYGAGTAVFLAAALIALHFSDADLARSVVIVFGGLLIAVFALLPLALGLEDPLDPRKFSLLGLTNTSLATALGVASLISVPSAVIVVIAVAQTETWSRGGGEHLLSIIAAILIVLTAVLSARISSTLAGLLASNRRSRTVSTLIGVILLIVAVPVVVSLATVDWSTQAAAVLGSIANVVGWTPLGLAWSVPADSAIGLESQALGKLALAIAWVLILLVVWRVLVGAALVNPGRRNRSETKVGLGWFDRLPGTPAGAIAARSITYWVRDARYSTSLAVVPLVPIVMIAALLVAGMPLYTLALLPVPVMCLFLAWSAHNDVAFDNSAIWLHLASSTRGIDDRWGRIVPALGIGTLLASVGSVISVAFYGDWAVLPALIGVSASILFVGLGLSSVVSARFPYPATRPGDSPSQQPQAGGNSAGLIQGLSFVGTLVLSLPAIGAAVLGFLVNPAWHFAALALGLGIGVAALLGGVRAGAVVYDRRTSELLAAALKN
jgi:ABC-2 type transport system permease protein